MQVYGLQKEVIEIAGKKLDTVTIGNPKADFQDRAFFVHVSRDCECKENGFITQAQYDRNTNTLIDGKGKKGWVAGIAPCGLADSVKLQATPEIIENINIIAKQEVCGIRYDRHFENQFCFNCYFIESEFDEFWLIHTVKLNGDDDVSVLCFTPNGFERLSKSEARYVINDFRVDGLETV